MSVDEYMVHLPFRGLISILVILETLIISICFLGLANCSLGPSDGGYQHRLGQNAGEKLSCV